MKRYVYGSLGFLSLLGLIGIFTEERIFLSYLAFVVNFEYFFKKTDEMMDEYMGKSSINGFYGGMIAMAIITLISMISMTPYQALTLGLAWGWSVSIGIHALSTLYYG